MEPTQYELIEKLKGNFTDDQVKVLYELFTYRNTEIVATKTDLHVLERNITKGQIELEKGINKTLAENLWKTVGFLTGIVTVLLAVAKAINL